MKRYLVTLTEEAQAKVREVIAKRHHKAAIVKRAYVLLSLDENRSGGRLTDDESRQPYHVGQRLIERLRQRFVLASFAAARHAYQQTRVKEKTFDGRVEAQWIALRCATAPCGYQKWSLR